MMNVQVKNSTIEKAFQSKQVTKHYRKRKAMDAFVETVFCAPRNCLLEAIEKRLETGTYSEGALQESREDETPASASDPVDDPGEVSDSQGPTISVPLQWRGPYALFGDDAPIIFYDEKVRKLQGIFLFTVEREGQYLVHRLGHAKNKFAASLKYCVEEYLTGKTPVEKAEELAQWRRSSPLWDGKRRGGRIPEFLESCEGGFLQQEIWKTLKLFRLFFAPIEIEETLGQQVVERLTDHLDSQGEAVKSFLFKEDQQEFLQLELLPKAQNKGISITSRCSLGHSIIGLEGEISEAST